MGIMGEYGDRTRGRGWFRLFLGFVVFKTAPGPCKCFHGPFNSKCHSYSSKCSGACHPSGKPCK
jgi:hypothetical protein